MINSLLNNVYTLKNSYPEFYFSFKILVFGFIIGLTTSVGWFIGFFIGWLQGVSHGFLLYKRFYKNQKDVLHSTKKEIKIYDRMS